MFENYRAVILSGMIAVAGAVGGCASDRPHEVGRVRPAVDDLDHRDRGLQSKDVVDASDQVAMYLLQLPDFNGPTRKTMVVTAIENHTSNPTFNYDIFIQRLKTNIGMHGRDRLFLVENKERAAKLRSQELEGNSDTFGQGAGAGSGAPASSVQPEFALYGIFSDLPNRGTDYYHCEFTVTNLKTREQIPLQPFEVKVQR